MRISDKLNLDKVSLREEGRAQGDVQQVWGSGEARIWDHRPREQQTCIKPRPFARRSTTRALWMDVPYPIDEPVEAQRVGRLLEVTQPTGPALRSAYIGLHKELTTLPLPQTTDDPHLMWLEVLMWVPPEADPEPRVGCK